MQKRVLIQSLAAAALAALLPVAALAADKEVVIGITAGPHAQIAEVAKRVAEKNGLKVRLVEFTATLSPQACRPRATHSRWRTPKRLT
jgi:D-methionine transport system substrate-binding protein